MTLARIFYHLKKERYFVDPFLFPDEPLAELRDVAVEADSALRKQRVDAVSRA